MSEHHERVVEGVLLRVRSRELGLAALVRRTEDVVVRKEIVEAQRLHAGPDAANRGLQRLAQPDQMLAEIGPGATQSNRLGASITWFDQAWP